MGKIPRAEMRLQIFSSSCLESSKLPISDRLLAEEHEQVLVAAVMSRGAVAPGEGLSWVLVKINS